ncbi:MAG: HEAT repeat domain-containing protein [Calothrix sp. MO_192.B10]|nr:HEAT repeat domain-containing protein [Calothrix sp. MO_192.B10]
MFIPIPASAVSYGVTHNSLLAQSTSTEILRIGSRGKEVELLQIQLQKLGYYGGAIDGKYGITTRNAVYKFQQEQELSTDGNVGDETRKQLQVQVNKSTSLIASTTPPSIKHTPQSSGKGFVWWSLMGIGILGSIGALLYCVKWFSHQKKLPNTDISPTNSTHNQHSGIDFLGEHHPQIKSQKESELSVPQTQLLPLENTSRLAKINIVEELVTDLRSEDGNQRRKAIWNLGQQGDSRAIQPLVDLMIDGDSQQRSLILAALAEISTRNLKPLNRALAISLQDESPQVRQNAIRDLTRVYDMMAQVSQMLYHAIEDPDAEVQETAKYALGQMNRMRSLSNDLSSPSPNSVEHKSTEHNSNHSS